MDNSSSNKKKILIVEDDFFIRDLYEIQARKTGYEVVTATDGEEALAKVKEELPNLVILDIMLPKMDGIEMAKKIKEKGIKSQMIFLTNLNDAEHISEALSTAGKTDYIVKSDIGIDAIVERVKDQLGIKSNH